MLPVLSVAQFRENVPAWSCFHSREDVFPAFFQRVLTLKDIRDLSVAEKINYVLFMINCFQVRLPAVPFPLCLGLFLSDLGGTLGLRVWGTRWCGHGLCSW